MPMIHRELPKGTRVEFYYKSLYRKEPAQLTAAVISYANGQYKLINISGVNYTIPLDDIIRVVNG